MHADKTNRTMLVLLAVVALAAGVAGLLVNRGVIGTSMTRASLFDNPVSRFIGDNGGWLWPVFAVVCALIVLLCLRWIAALLVSTDRAGDLTLPGDRKAGRTTVKTSALTTALVDELESYRGTDSAKARLVGDDDAPDLVVEVTAVRTADLAALRHRIESEALAHARQALGRPDLPIRLDLDVSRRAPDRVGA